ncbi:MAG TPA: 2,3-bisphosphoglycerate-independent phosphoglycerate mutase [Candidatus Bipolaricaulota bacterium]|nr:2,3-bisphosphoglycerate-independent phosphoglycerate mutase [Candidatus Bipolaricaulota bacterium]
MSSKSNLPLIFMILDGWGLAQKNRGNAIELAKKPNYDFLIKKYPSTSLFAHGHHVGLPDLQVGNSESGHMNIGAGKVVVQDSVIISKAIKNGTFYKNPAFIQLIKHVNSNESDLHLMGLISLHSSPHMSLEHLLALTKLVCKQCKRIYLHLFTDGRDSPQFAAADILRQVQKKLPENAFIASLIGRYFAMDRNKKWERTQKAYEMLTSGQGEYFGNFDKAILHSYNRGLTDEFLEPSLILNGRKKTVLIKDNDGVIFFNLRSDRARQLAKAFVQKDFNQRNPKSFRRKKALKNLSFVALTDFGPDLDHILTAFPSITLKNTMPKVLENLRQVYVAETEKYAHITYFLNGGSDVPVNGEDRIKIPSPNVRSYDLKPEMSAYKITDKILDLLSKRQYDYFAVNFANPDMVGHTGNLDAAVKAICAVDKCVGAIYKRIKAMGGSCVISADHGNAEKMIDLKTGEKYTEHTTNKVPFIVVSSGKQFKLKSGGRLANVLPTILRLLDQGDHKIRTKSLT